MKFCALTLGAANAAHLAFFLTNTAQLADPRRSFALSSEDIARLNPNTSTCPIFRSKIDAEITKKIYQHNPVFHRLISPESNPWKANLNRIFDMGKPGDQNLAMQSRSGEHVKMYEAKYFWQYDHRLLSILDGEETVPDESSKSNPNFEVSTSEVMDIEEVEKRLRQNGLSRKWMIAYRDITNATNERTVIAAILPKAATNYTVRVCISQASATEQALLIGAMNSIVLDYVARQKLGGTHLSDYIFRQLPLLEPRNIGLKELTFIVPRVLELTYTSKDLRPFYDDLVDENPAWDQRTSTSRGEPFRWDQTRRARLCAELDAFYAKLYGFTGDELRYILDPKDVMGEDYPSETFRVLKDKEIRQFGEYRTRRLVLEAWDRLSDLETNQVSTSGLPQSAGVAAKPIYSAIGVIRNEADARFAGVLLNLVREANSITLQNVTLAVTMLQEPGRASLLLNDSDAAQLASFVSSIGSIDETNVTAILTYLEDAGVVRRENQGTLIKSLPSEPLPSGIVSDQDSTKMATLLLKAIAAREAQMKKKDMGLVDGQESKRRA
jgi:hypothetical protein